MKYFVIDTESSGLFDFAQPADAPGQPRLATLGIIAFDLLEDGTIEDEREFSFMVKPDGWELSPEAAAVNGLTNERLAKEGEPVLGILASYVNFIELGYVLAAFNCQFDSKIMRGELRRAGLDDRFTKTPNICLMRASTPICCVPKKTRSGFKFPKLSEACAFFGIEQPAAHSAMGDARSAVAIFRELVKRGALPKPEVHFAKEKPQPTQ